MENILDKINSRLEAADGKVTELEDILIEITPKRGNINKPLKTTHRS